MNPDDFKVAVAASNGRPQRLVSIEPPDGREFRDTIDPNSRTSRKRLIHEMAHNRGLELTELDFLDGAIIAAADASDEYAEKVLAENEDRRSTADLLVDLALERYRIGRTQSDEAFAVERDGPNVAIMLRGARDALRAILAREFRKLHGRTPNSSALSDALNTLQGEAYEAEPEDVHLRVAQYEGQIAIDIGDASGQAILVGPAGWHVVPRSPVLFRRTAVAAPLPVPTRGGSLSELKELINASTETWPLVIGWLVAAFFPNIPHPILLLGGQQGTGKTTAAKLLGSIIDHSTAQLRSQPRDPETWAITACGSWAIAIDNISTISDWWSDSLCKAVTGDGWLRRKLYTDGDVAVLSFRRVVLLTSIDAGALRGDLGDRILLVDLEPISERSRRTETEIDASIKAASPRILGALLTKLSATLRQLPHVGRIQLPRMADFGKILAAMDLAADGADGSAMKMYMDQRERIAQSVVESDPVALAVETLVETEGYWTGSAEDLVAQITPERPPKGWPTTAQAMGGRITRLVPALAQSGVEVTYAREGHKRRRVYRISFRMDGEADQPSAVSALSDASGIPAVDKANVCGQQPHRCCPPARAAEPGFPDADSADSDFSCPSNDENETTYEWDLQGNAD